MKHHYCCKAWIDFEAFINWFGSPDDLSGELVLPNFPCSNKKSSPWLVRYCPSCGAEIPGDVSKSTKTTN